MASATLAFTILARDNASRIFDGVGSASGRLGSSLKKTALKFAGIVGAAALAGKAVQSFGQFLGDSITEARESEKVGKTTAAIIKSTGGAAKVSAAQVGDLAEAISVKAGVDDEAIQTGANLLLTFKNVRNEAGEGSKVFDRATQAAVDLSSAGFGSVDGAAKMLGKALNDPLKGISALGKAGVTFTEQQKEQIKALMETGDVLGAQKIILGEVESQVGGVAAANATMGEKVRVAWDNFKESVGVKLLPVLDKLGAWFIAKGIPVLERFAGWVENKAAPALAKFGAWIEEKVLPPVSRFAGWISDDLWPALQRGYNEVMPALKKAWSDLTGSVGGSDIKWREIGAYITDVIIPVFVKVAQVYIPMMVNQFKIIGGALKVAWAAFQFLGDVIRTVMTTALGAFATMARGFAVMLRGLSVIPGFGWAKTAADKLENAARKADGLKAAVNRVPNSKATNFAANTGTAIGSVRALETKIAGVRGKNVTIGIHYAYTQSGSVYRSQVPQQARAGGGPILRGVSTLVGENGPEILTLNRSGHITPARQTAEALSGSRRSGGGSSDDGRPIVVQLMAPNGRMMQEVLVQHKRATGQNLGLA